MSRKRLCPLFAGAGRSPMKICHIITDLDTGGAEIMLLNLLRCMDRAAFAPQVISLTSVGLIGKQIESLGIPVRALGMRRGVPDPRGMFRLARLLRRDRPSVIQTWMYHANLLGGLAAKRAGKIPVAWGIHHTTLDPRENKKTTIWTAKLCGRLSGWLAQRIVCCAEATRELHVEQGYAADKMLVIPNGFDLERFKPDPEARRSVRKELEVAPDTPLIGLMARYHAQKDHHNFVQAAARLHEKLPETRFLLCGDGVTWD
ncbi:MAG TPA: phosphatidylinositol alpha-mannosyltransferase, partial [Firmicutes bacterium]|nr:phosphatidylinositol alpha-mannosyltransferase [Bacillota bacterium]